MFAYKRVSSRGVSRFGARVPDRVCPRLCAPPPTTVLFSSIRVRRGTGEASPRVSVGLAPRTY